MINTEGKVACIFASYGFQSPIVSDKLCGVVKPEGKNVLIVPFAGFDFQMCAQKESMSLNAFGFAKKNIYICSDIASIECRRYDYIYVPGGDTFQLLKEVQERGLVKVLQEAVREGSTYIGISAGAHLANESLQYVEVLEDNNYFFADYLGLGFVEDLLLPHSDQRELQIKIKCKQYARGGCSLICIPNDGVVIYEMEGNQSDIRYM